MLGWIFLVLVLTIVKEQTEVFVREVMCPYFYQTITCGLGFAFSNILHKKMQPFEGAMKYEPLAILT
jgi:hypothetical protein